MLSLISTVLDLVKGGKSTIDEIMADPKTQNELDNLTQVIIAEQKHGDAFTKHARPAAIYMCIFIMFNDLVLIDYVNMFFVLDIPHTLSEEKYSLMIGFLTSLGIARSVLDKQGNWLQNLFSKK